MQENSIQIQYQQYTLPLSSKLHVVYATVPYCYPVLIIVTIFNNLHIYISVKGDFAIMQDL